MVNNMKEQYIEFVEEDVDGCLDAAAEQLKAEGYEVHWANEIHVLFD